jgi:hypothetical protein
MKFSKPLLDSETDKLLTIFAAAGRVRAVAGSRYVASLSRDNFTHDMCWEPHFQERQVARYKSLRAPKFSWTSVAGNVFYNDDSIAKKAFCKPGNRCVVHETKCTGVWRSCR